MTGPYDAEEERRILATVRESGRGTCPDCGVVMDERSVPPRQDVSYVRRRIVLTCPSCRRSLALDRKELT